MVQNCTILQSSGAETSHAKKDKNMPKIYATVSEKTSHKLKNIYIKLSTKYNYCLFFSLGII